MWAGSPSWVEAFGKSACPVSRAPGQKQLVNGFVLPGYAPLAEV